VRRGSPSSALRPLVYGDRDGYRIERILVKYVGLFQKDIFLLPYSHDLQFKLSPKVEKPIDRSDFRRAAEHLQGSADLSAQLFCCLLRAVGVEARLVFSLQPLGFTAAAEPPPIPNQNSTSGKITLYAVSTDDESEGGQIENLIKTPVSVVPPSITTPSQTPQRIRRMGQSRTGENAPIDMGKPPPGLTTNRPTKVQRPQHPIFWVEAFNPAMQKWITVDAVHKNTAKPSRIEPAINDRANLLTYAIAFDEDGSAKDVTRRYAKAYNAKTRRWRVDCTPDGDKWYKKAVKIFKRHSVLVCWTLLSYLNASHTI
jgi:xeroderma pigmentosum group C-complementing protein